MSSDHPFAPTLEHAFTIGIELAGLQWVEPTSRGETRAAIYAAEGWVKGPLLNGKVIPMSGGDFPLVRPNGVIDFDARYLLEADNGDVIYLENRGYRWAKSPEIAEKMASEIESYPEQDERHLAELKAILDAEGSDYAR